MSRPEPEITSVANPLVKRLRKLRLRKFREADGTFLVEGITHVLRGIEHGAPFESLLVAPDLLASDIAWDAVERCREDGVDVVSLGRDAFESIVEREHPSGLAATVRIEDPPLTELSAAEGSLFVALHDAGNPGNVGSIIRTVDAVGGHGVVLVEESTDHRHPVAVKSSMGTIFSVPVRRARDFDELLAWALMEGVKVYTTSARAEESYWDVVYERPALFVFGSEATGLPAEVLAKGRAVTMPMQGSASSLNLAVAVGVVLFEAARQVR